MRAVTSRSGYRAGVSWELGERDRTGVGTGPGASGVGVFGKILS